MGLWVYDDPGLEVSRVRVDHNHAAGEPVVVGLAVWNPNDYDLSTARLQLQLLLDGVEVGSFDRDSIVAVPQVGLADVSIPLKASKNATRERLRTMTSGTHRVSVEGRATFSTPFGPRAVRFAHAGDLAFAGANEVEIGNSFRADSMGAAARRIPNAPRLPSVRPFPENVPRERPQIGGGGREPR
jgi:LEA14-like dessication related protein